MKITDIFESSTTAGAIATGTPAKIGKTQKRAGSLFKGKVTNKPFYEAEVNEEEIVEQDLILVPDQIIKKDKGFIPHEKDRRDHEVEMARSELFAAAKDAQRIYKMIQNRSEDEGLMGWQQSYITLAADYLNSVADSLEHRAATEGAGVLAGGMSNFEEDAVTELSPKTKKSYSAAAKLDKKFNDNSIEKAKRMSKEQPHKKAEWEDEIEFLKSVNAKRDRGLARAEVAEGKCPECGGPSYEDESIAEAKDACYHKVKSRYKVWPSAYASGALVKCRKVGASNWGNKSKK